MSGSYYSDDQIIYELSSITLGGHTPDEETLEKINTINLEHRKDMVMMLEAWAQAIKETYDP
jgi:hypothetical protein